jgi:hypothetical protein
MKQFAIATAATALVALLAAGAPARAEDCETVVTALTEAVAIATKNFETTMDELKQLMSQGAPDEKKKATVKNQFCSASGEVLGASRATRAVAGACGEAQKSALAQFDKSIKEMETAIDGTCK